MKAGETITQDSVIAIERQGAISANPTYKLTTDRQVGDGLSNKGIVKGDYQVGTSARDDTNVMLLAGLGEGFVDELTQEVAIDPHLIVRSVAASRLDAMLGLNVIAPEEFGMIELPDQEGEQEVTVSGFVEGVSILSVEGGEYYRNQFDYSDPRLQKGLSDLQVSHFLSGQIDGHGGNIFIDEDLNVRGIDNDLCLGVIDPTNVTGEAKEKTPVRLPTIIHSDTARKVEQTSEAALRETLSSVESPSGKKLSAGEIDAAVDRLKQAKEQIQMARIEQRVVEDFSRGTFKQTLEADRYARMVRGDAFGSYTAREHNNQQACNHNIATDGKNIPLRVPVMPERTEVGRTLAQQEQRVAEMSDKLTKNLIFANNEPQKLDQINKRLDVIDATLSRVQERKIGNPFRGGEKPHEFKNLQSHFTKKANQKDSISAIERTTTDPVKINLTDYKEMQNRVRVDPGNRAAMIAMETQYIESTLSSEKVAELLKEKDSLCNDASQLKTDISRQVEANLLKLARKNEAKVDDMRAAIEVDSPGVIFAQLNQVNGPEPTPEELQAMEALLDEIGNSPDRPDVEEEVAVDRDEAQDQPLTIGDAWNNTRPSQNRASEVNLGTNRSQH